MSPNVSNVSNLSNVSRFFAGAGYMLPFFDDFDFYFRLDSDSLCARPIPDHFSALEVNGWVERCDERQHQFRTQIGSFVQTAITRHSSTGRFEFVAACDRTKSHV